MNRDPITLFTFKYKDRNGELVYTPPMELTPLQQAVAEIKLEGEFCVCIIIPDFRAVVDLRLTTSESLFLNGGMPEMDIEKIKEQVNVGSNSKPATRTRRRPSKNEEKHVEPVREESV